MQDKMEMREVYCATLIDLAKTNKDICIVEADLTNCIKTSAFQKAYPDRFFNVGIAEANMVGICAGLATCGKIPFCSSFATFASRRCFDQAFISVGYSKQKVTIVGTDPGICAELNGGTHMPFEDMALMRTIPNMLCIEPTDATMLAKIMPMIVESADPVYLRLQRKNAETIFNIDDTFDLKKAKVIKDGTDATVIASGIMVAKAVEASKILAEQGYSVAVLNTFTWKPLDEESVIKYAKSTKAVVVAENHNRINGLFYAVADVLAQNCPTVMESVAVQDEYGQVGKMDFLAETYHLTTQDIVKATLRAIRRKQ